jgi:hypothetical protein
MKKTKTDKFIKDHKKLYEDIQEHIEYLVVLKGYNPEEGHPPFNKHSVRLATKFIMSSILKHIPMDWP